MNRRFLVSILVGCFVLLSFVGPAMAASGEVLVLHFDEGSGNIAGDTSGHGNDGTIYGATWIDGLSGKALSFDGVNDYVSVPDSDSLDITNEITIEAWIFSREFKSPYSLIISKGAYGTDKGADYETALHSTGYYGDYAVYRLKDDNYGAEYKIYQFSPNTWYHLAITFNKRLGEVKAYINGDLQRTWSKSNNIYDSVRPLYFGVQEHRVGTKEGYFNGIIDEVRIYNRALSANEIKEHYEGEKPATPTPTPTPSKGDSDGDGWSDEKEELMGTNPYSVDSDKDGINDPQDPNPTVPEEEKGLPGFEAVFTLVGLLAVAYLVLRRR